jgi:hypothetical protein
VLAEMLTTDADGKTEVDRLVLKYMGLTDEWFFLKNSWTF